jgi:hypothetical protein
LIAQFNRSLRGYGAVNASLNYFDRLKQIVPFRPLSLCTLVSYPTFPFVVLSWFRPVPSSLRGSDLSLRRSTNTRKAPNFLRRNRLQKLDWLWTRGSIGKMGSPLQEILDDMRAATFGL